MVACKHQFINEKKMKKVILNSKFVFMLFIIAFACSCTPEDGIDGMNGTDGTDGTNGINGDDGYDGVNGQDGANGQNGTNGADGQNGTNGQDGQDATTYSIGDFAQGGIVFWLDETKQHGLICAKNDLNNNNGIHWHAGTNGRTRATGNGLFAGENNTLIIISALVAIGDDGEDYAALQSNELVVAQNGNSYGDWYLPSRVELITLRQNKVIINNVALANGGTTLVSELYWTSTESSASTAWGYNLSNNTGGTLLKTSAHHARAIRAF